MGNNKYRNLDSSYYIRRKPKKKRIHTPVIIGVAATLILITVISVIFLVLHKDKTTEDAADLSTIQEEIPQEEVAPEQPQEVAPETEPEPEPDVEVKELSPEVASFAPGYTVNTTDSTADIVSEEVISENAVLIDVDKAEVVAKRAADVRICPASMTKILTILVAAEHVENLDDTYTITRDITDFTFSNDCSIVGFDVDETVTVRDLMYGTILPSGADAGLALANYVAGSHEAFVDMMNAKLDELGLSGSAHFTNCVGIYDEDHYCTLTDMAMIMKAAVENDLAREILSAHKYTTSATEQHPEGITISNWFLRRIEDKDTGGNVMCAKTGFVNQSGCCAASYTVSNSGGHYICVSANAWSSWRCIYDQVEIYTKYMK
ncbi:MULTISPECIES: D-alanyl-D-alanine carboxypeptidase family protein [unclassified Butyrivibrio]|uniref:D-alanyl-D-alanine carboxypeptidase family protein n=1 Tax=unclassified Butyrivibrio TaxID=2639466 RepID=UPI0003B598C2|nr:MULTISPECIES: serine hydrolase [unclassified Butyrivibrio]